MNCADEAPLIAILRVHDWEIAELTLNVTVEALAPATKSFEVGFMTAVPQVGVTVMVPVWGKVPIVKSYDTSAVMDDRKLFTASVNSRRTRIVVFVGSLNCVWPGELTAHVISQLVEGVSAALVETAIVSDGFVAPWL